MAEKPAGDLLTSNSRQADRDNLINDPEIVSTISCQGRATWSDLPDPRCIRRDAKTTRDHGREKRLDKDGRQRETERE